MAMIIVIVVMAVLLFIIMATESARADKKERVVSMLFDKDEIDYIFYNAARYNCIIKSVSYINARKAEITIEGLGLNIYKLVHHE